jgi:NADPH-dependent glutamate synthase beta subunit-like oxidoreductase
MIGIIKGMYTTGKHFFRKAITVQYPNEKSVLTKRYRGLLRLHGMIGEMGEVPDCEYLPPCSTGCPAHVDARGQNILIAENKLPEAHILVRERNTMPGVLGRVCHHPCETLCKRGHYDGSVSIRNLHRTIADGYFEGKTREENPNKGSKGKSVGIIGGGPSGITAAYDLVKLDYDVTIYEKNDVAGGALASGIPKYRLPREILQREIKDIERLGVVIKTGMEAGKDFSVDDLFDKGHSAVLISVGLQISRSIPIPGVDLEGVELALPFLADVNFDKPIMPGKKVIVVGGGNVAMDVARCAKRVGYGDVKVVCLESSDEMPAYGWEIEEAKDEGVIFHNCMGPQEILGKDGKVTGFKFNKCLSVFDETGRFNPKFDESCITQLDCDTVIIAIGQGSELSFLKDSGVELNERGQLLADKTTLATSRPGVFASGEVVTGPGSAIGSIAKGHEVAISIDKYLSGKDLLENRPVYKVKEWHDAIPGMRLEGYDEFKGGDISFVGYTMPNKPIHERVGSFIPALPVTRSSMPITPAEERVKDCREVETGLKNDIAFSEAWRCLRCESRKCILCGVCANVCPVDAIEIEIDQVGGERVCKKWDLNIGICTYCGICSENCPTQTLFHSNEYELATDSREKFVYHKGRLLMSSKEEKQNDAVSSSTNIKNLTSENSDSEICAGEKGKREVE